MKSVVDQMIQIYYTTAESDGFEEQSWFTEKFRSIFKPEIIFKYQKSFTLAGLKDSIKFVVMVRGRVWTGYWGLNERRVLFNESGTFSSYFLWHQRLMPCSCLK